jgi:nitroreductase
MMTTLDDLMAEASKDRRVCPQPMIWNRLWDLLLDRRRVGMGWEPPLPLILAAWWVASDSQKRSRFHEHLRWASEHGAIEFVANLITNMTPDDWHTEQ